ncbi:barstar family protein [Streptomyces sp. NPDC052020]|uniref:barstar family protein n=1 Tax=Streptomyces sp. NPDC052020 TaxID=3155677 RepID=UPI00341CC404
MFPLDGRHIADRDTFHCAIGEALNGPGGHFGWYLDALDDCLGGGRGATPPFTLHWDSSAETRARLAERVAIDPFGWRRVGMPRPAEGRPAMRWASSRPVTERSHLRPR